MAATVENVAHVAGVSVVTVSRCRRDAPLHRTLHADPIVRQSTAVDTS